MFRSQLKLSILHSTNHYSHRPTAFNNPYEVPEVACDSPPKAPVALGTSCLQPRTSRFKEVFDYPFDLVQGTKALTVEEFPELKELAGIPVGRPGRAGAGAAGLEGLGGKPEERKRGWEVRLPCFPKRFGIKIEVLGRKKGGRKSE